VPAGIAAFFGLAAATLRVQRVAGPILARTTGASFVGTVEDLDEREEGLSDRADRELRHSEAGGA
jgi:competence protein ComEC